MLSNLNLIGTNVCVQNRQVFFFFFFFFFCYSDYLKHIFLIIERILKFSLYKIPDYSGFG